MLQNGLSRDLFERWCTDKKNGCMIAGYSVQGTLAHEIKTHPTTVTSLSGIPIELKMTIHYVRFACHADYPQTKSLIAQLNPKHVVLVHGAPMVIERLKQQLDKEFVDTNFVSPDNCESVKIQFRRKKEIKVLGKLSEHATNNTRISGLMIKKDFHHQLLIPDDLPLFTPIATSEIDQELLVYCNQSLQNIHLFLSSVYDTELLQDSKEIRVHDVLSIRWKKNHLVLKWMSSPVNDMIADSVVGLIMTLHTDVTGAVAKILEESSKPEKDEKHWFGFFLKEHFGEKVRYDEELHQYQVNVSETENAIIKLSSKKNSPRPSVKVSATSEALQNKLELLLSCVDTAIYPLPKQG